MKTPVFGGHANVTVRTRKKSYDARKKSRKFEDELDLDGRIQRQHGDTHSASRVGSGVTKNLAKQFRCAVNDARLAGESGVGCDKADNLDDLINAIERTDDAGYRGKRVQHAGTSEVFGVLRGDFGTDLAGPAKRSGD